MKGILLLATIMISVATFAQKIKLKPLKRALKAGKSQETVTILTEQNR
jgi:hypothetical protein